MIEVGTFRKLYDLITDDFIQFGAVVAVVLFHNRVNTVVTQATDIAAPGVNDLVEQSELCIAAIGHVQPVWLDNFLITSPARRARRHRWESRQRESQCLARSRSAYAAAT